MPQPNLTSVSSRTRSTLTIAAVLEEFLAHLIRSGLSEGYSRRLHVRAEQFLVWLEKRNLEITSIDGSILHRYWICAGRTLGFESWGFRLIGFLEDSGRIAQLKWMTDGIRLLDEFFEQYTAQSYAPNTIEGYRGSCRHFICWLHLSRIPVNELDERTVAGFIDHDCICPGSGFRRGAKEARNRPLLERFVRFLLARSGIDSDVFAGGERAAEDDLTAFRIWLRRSRGIGESTIDCHIREIAATLPSLGADPKQYDAACIKVFAMRCFRELSGPCAQKRMSSLRMYLRYLASKGRCAPEIISAVPSIPKRQHAALPGYISEDDVERVIESCDMTTPAGQRNKAILLLLARLGLRGGDIVDLKLTDIDWKQAQIHVCGKSGRYVALPLPQDVGDALLNYIEYARPRIEGERKVFLLALAPYRPLSGPSVISSIVNDAVSRSGVRCFGRRGARLLRHSAATNLLRGGSSLELVGTLLRHRSPDTTAIYAKVNFPMLQTITEPWMGGVS